MRICPRCQLKYPDDNDRCFVDGAALELMPDERIGTLLAGRYLLESAIGEGGMATVYRARHTLVDRPVAIKVMAKHLTKDASLRERFRRDPQTRTPTTFEIYGHGSFSVPGELQGLFEPQPRLPKALQIPLPLRGVVRPDNRSNCKHLFKLFRCDRTTPHDFSFRSARHFKLRRVLQQSHPSARVVLPVVPES